MRCGRSSSWGALVVMGVAACGSDGTSAEGAARTAPRAEPSPPTSARDAGADASTDGATEPTPEEREPNNGATTSETNAMIVPGAIRGAIDPAADVDVFTIAAAPGELWEWRLTPDSRTLAPSLAVFDTTPDTPNPPRVASAEPGYPAILEHFVLRPGAFAAAVRDARNVPASTGVGGPDHRYTLLATKVPVSAVPLPFPGKVAGRLKTLGSLDFFSFNGTKGAPFRLIVKAARKVPSSTLDSRLSLFLAATNTAVHTNDDAGRGATDSEIGGELPESGSYLVILESEGTDARDLSYEIELRTTP